MQRRKTGGQAVRAGAELRGARPCSVALHSLPIATFRVNRAN